jgi:hypothetical protein
VELSERKLDYWGHTLDKDMGRDRSSGGGAERESLMNPTRLEYVNSMEVWLKSFCSLMHLQCCAQYLVHSGHNINVKVHKYLQPF